MNTSPRTIISSVKSLTMLVERQNHMWPSNRTGQRRIYEFFQGVGGGSRQEFFKGGGRGRVGSSKRQVRANFHTDKQKKFKA